MTKKVVFTRTRTVREKVEIKVTSANPEDAIAAATHMLESEQVSWQFVKTMESSTPSVEVIEEITPRR